MLIDGVRLGAERDSLGETYRLAFLTSRNGLLQMPSHLSFHDTVTAQRLQAGMGGLKTYPAPCGAQAIAE
jgi:hypothetical protein